MKKKIIGIFICLFFISILISPSNAKNLKNITSDEVEIDIYAGHFGKDIGFGISIDVLNHKEEDVKCDVELEYDFIFRNHRDFNHEYNFTIPPEKYWSNRQSTGLSGIKYIKLTAKVEDIIVSRIGISIGKLMIFTE